MFRCQNPKCKKEVLWLFYLSPYGRTSHKTKDEKEYCEECFNKKFKEKHDKDK